MTSTEALAAAGYTHRRTDRGGSAHDIIDAEGATVATLKASDVWEWLRSGPHKSSASADNDSGKGNG